MRQFTENDWRVGVLNNQMLLFGTNPSFSDAKCTVFLDYVEYTGNIIVKDGDGVAKTGSLANGVLDMAHAPLRLEKGISITGDVLLAKFFVIRG